MDDQKARIYRSSHIIVLELDSGEFYLVTSLSTSKQTELIGIDPTTGALRFSGRLGIDLFSSEAQALQYLRGTQCAIKSSVSAQALLGYAPLGTVALLLVATKVRASVETLPGNDAIFTVTDSQWVKIPLRNPQPQPKGEIKTALELTDTLINDVHFFCETRDISRPFPSPHPVSRPDPEFVWNGWLSSPFRAVGLPQHCPALLQGMAESRSFFSADGQKVIIALTARRSRLHPGTRYLARGLNAASSTGNEIECEQLVWPANPTPGKSFGYSTYTWRRGTVPLWWGAEIKSTVQEAEIYVAERQPPGAARYYQRLAARYAPPPEAGTDVATYGEVPSEQQEQQQGHGRNDPPLVCVNLLRVGLGKPELILSQHFQESVVALKSSPGLGLGKLQLLNYDWHANVKAIGEPETVLNLWRMLQIPTREVGISVGEYDPSPPKQPWEAGKSKGEALVPNMGLGGGAFRLLQAQRGVIRFNCADSLDRTNAASYFGAVQVLAEQCGVLGVSIDTNPSFRASNHMGGSSPAEGGGGGNEGLHPGVLQSLADSLPPGWEMRKDLATQKLFYIDHNTRMTTWTHPCPRPAPPGAGAQLDPLATGSTGGLAKQPLHAPWRRFGLTVQEFKESILPLPLGAMSDLFLLGGDTQATLYTGSKAMHSHVIQIFREDASKAKRASTAASLAITLQRRYLNIVRDSSRHKQLEVFLGLRSHRHFPSLPSSPLQVVSRPYACLLKPLPTKILGIYPPSSILSSRAKFGVWICPPSVPVIEVYLYLSEPCLVTHVMLTVAHGADDTSVPVSFDVRTGQHLDDLILVLEGASIPTCAHGTPLLYPLPLPCEKEDLADGSHATWHSSSASESEVQQLGGIQLCPFEEEEGALNFLSRVVAITFYPRAASANPPSPSWGATLGQLEVLGASVVSACHHAEMPPDQHAAPGGEQEAAGVLSTSSHNGQVAGSQSSNHGVGGDFVDLLSGDWLPPAQQAAEGAVAPLLADLDDLGGQQVADHGFVHVGAEGRLIAPPSGNGSLRNSVGGAALEPAGWELYGTLGSPHHQGGLHLGGGANTADSVRHADLLHSPRRHLSVENGAPFDDDPEGPVSAVGGQQSPLSHPLNEHFFKPLSHPLEDAATAGSGPENPKVAEASDVASAWDALETPLEEYAMFVERLSKGDLKVSFSEAMEAEIVRLRLGLSSSQRNQALQVLGRSPSQLDPNRLLTPTEAQQRRMAAGQLAALTLTAAEDAELASIGFHGHGREGDGGGGSPEERDAVGVGDCRGGKCEVRFSKAETGASALDRGLAEGHQFGWRAASAEEPEAPTDETRCHHCQRWACLSCLASHRSALLLPLGEAQATGSPGGTMPVAGTAPGWTAGSTEGPARGPIPADLALCKECCTPLVRDAVLLDRVRILGAARRRNRVCRAAAEAAAHLRTLGCHLVAPGGSMWRADDAVEGWDEDHETSLAEAPYAGLLFSVHAAPGSASAETLLAKGQGPPGVLWEAPADAQSAEIAIVLATPGILSRVVLHTGGRAYSADNAPTVKILVGDTVLERDQKHAGIWSLRESLTAGRQRQTQSQSQQPETGEQVLAYNLPIAMSCRFVWLRFSFPDASSQALPPGPPADPAPSPPPHIDEGFDLLTLDDFPTVNRGLAKAANQGAPRNRRSIYAQRVRLIGSRLATGAGEPPAVQGVQVEERLELKTLLELASPLCRMRVNVEGERAAPGGRLVELFVASISPHVAGFRLDGLLAVRSMGVKCDPLVEALGSPQQIATCREQDLWIAAPPRLVLQVFIRVDGNGPLKRLAEFMLPLVRTGTAMYFDFQEPTLAKVLVFVLSGASLSSFEESADASDGDSPPSGTGSLSLASKIKLYRYVAPAELTTWAHLNPI